MKKNLKINVLWATFLAVVFVTFSVLSDVGIFDVFYQQILIQIGINIILGVGLNLVIGFSGQFSLGHAGFMAIGAYSGAIIGIQIPTYFGFFLSILIGMLISGALALLIGVPTLRLKGDYLAIATLGCSEIIRILIINGGKLTNGATGLTGIPVFTNWQLVYLFATLTTIIILNFLNSSTGRETIAIREDEIAAESSGVNIIRIKVITFVIGAVSASIAGALQAGYIGTVVPKDYSFMNTVSILIVIVFGGLGSITGTIFSAIVLGLINMFLQDVSSVRMIVYSLILIMVMIFRPSGLLGTMEFKLSDVLGKKERRMNGNS